jgi:thiol-disulfide isomerase/thioredoxin
MMPKVEQLYEKYGDEVAFIMVSYGEEGVSEVKERYNLILVILIDLDGEVFDKYGVWGVPTFFVLDREHRIVWSEAGEMDVGELESALGNVL